MSSEETTQVRRFWPPWGKGSPTLFLLGMAFLLAAVILLFMGEDAAVFGMPTPIGVSTVLLMACTVCLMANVLVEKGKIPFFIGALSFWICVLAYSSVGYRMQIEERNLQVKAELTVWREAHCTRDSLAPGCENFQRLFSGRYCAPEVPESACMREIAPYLEEARARRTAASAP